jgi:hypothetical protein
MKPFTTVAVVVFALVALVQLCAWSSDGTSRSTACTSRYGRA